MNDRIGLILLCLTLSALNARKQPHIVVVIADDLGWSDVGYQKLSKIKTPCIDRLAKMGIILSNHYAQPLCSPSRASLLTGKYPIRLGSGLVRDVFFPADDHALSSSEKLLPEFLREKGYLTSLIGKWHLGSSRWAATPTKRGFDKFFGFYTGAIDYYKHNKTDGACEKAGHEASFLDFRNQTRPYRDRIGVYSTDIFNVEARKFLLNHQKDVPLFLVMSYQNVHTPLEAQETYINKYVDFNDEQRRIYAAMATHLDDSVELLRRSLQETGMWENTIFLFLSDNGGDPSAGGYNWPLRGAKGTVWEGGVKCLAFITGGFLNQEGIQTERTYEKLVHISDWFPTLLHAAGMTTIPGEIDGIDIWPLLKDENGTVRDILLHNINYKSCSIRKGDWKLITDVDVGWAMPPEMDTTNHTRPQRPIDVKEHEGSFNNDSLPVVENGLFNIRKDPNERENLSKKHPDIVKSLLSIIKKYEKEMKPDNNKFQCDLRALETARKNNIWGPFLDK